jgi:flagellar hook-length control protein FliK
MSSVAPSPSLNNISGALPAQFVQLAPGDVITALVLSLIKDTTFRLQLPAGTLDVQADKPLVPGTRVELAVAGTEAEPTITLTALPDSGKTSRVGAGLQTGAPIDAQSATRPQVQAPLSQPDTSVQIAATIVRDAATRQGGIAPLYADLEASIAQPSLPIPAPVVAAAKQLFALRLDTTGPVSIDADDIKAALERSGLVIDPAPASAGPRPAGPLDARAVLLSLREALTNWENAERTPQQTMAAASSAAPASVMPPAAAANPSRASGPMLPYPNGPTVPQAAADSSLPPNATPRELALHLLDKTDSAIAREMLLKIASLPDRADLNTKPADATSRMTFDIPMATANGTAVAQIRIERDGAQRNGDTVQPVWRANFSVDIEPIGAVHVRISLIGGKAAVTLNAERSDSAESLSAGLPLLEAGLRNAELEPGILNCQVGQPAAASADHGLYVDHAS